MIKKLSSLFIVSLMLVLHQPLHEPARAADLKIEIHKIKDSGSSPFWSPDGKEIVYIDKGGLYVISADSSGKSRKIVNGAVRLPRWAFNKTALVYEMLGVRGGIYIAKIPD